MDLGIILGILATTLGMVGYFYYLRDIFAGKTKPHAFSWLIWGTLSGIGFVAQVIDGGGPGAWSTGAGSAVSLLIFFLAIFKGERDIDRTDWISLAGSLIALIFWIVASAPLITISLIMIIDASGYIPTFRKSRLKPYEETIAEYLMAGTKHSIGLLALSTYTLLTVPYVLSLAVMNFVFIAYVLHRRRVVAQATA